MSTMPVELTVDPLVGPRFAVEVEGIEQATFSECSGLTATVRLDKWEEGGSNSVALKFPGRAEFDNLTLKRGFTDSQDLFKWFTDCARGGKKIRKTVTIKLVRPKELQTVQTWTCLNAFPVKWSGPSMQVGSNAVAIESLEFAHEGLLKA